MSINIFGNTIEQDTSTTPGVSLSYLRNNYLRYENKVTHDMDFDGYQACHLKQPTQDHEAVTKHYCDASIPRIYTITCSDSQAIHPNTWTNIAGLYLDFTLTKDTYAMISCSIACAGHESILDGAFRIMKKVNGQYTPLTDLSPAIEDAFPVHFMIQQHSNIFTTISFSTADILSKDTTQLVVQARSTGSDPLPDTLHINSSSTSTYMPRSTFNVMFFDGLKTMHTRDGFLNNRHVFSFDK